MFSTTRSNFLAGLGLLLLGFMMTDTAVGQSTYTWNSTTTSGAATWDTGSNWTGGAVSYPGDTSTPTILYDTANFGSGLTGALTISTSTATNLYLNAINFNNTSGFSYNIATSAIINLGGATAPTISVTGSATESEMISAVLAGTQGLSFTGPGTLVLTGANTFTGGTTINSGKLNINSNAALGGTGSGVTVNQGATLQFAAGSTLTLSSNRSIVLNGTAVTQNTVLTSANSATIDTNFANSVTIAGVVSGVNLLKVGAGTLTLNAVNTYTGNTQINAGAISVGSTGLLPAGTPLSLVNSTLASSIFPTTTSLYLYNTTQTQMVGLLYDTVTSAATGNTTQIFLASGVTLDVDNIGPTGGINLNYSNFSGTIFGGGNLQIDAGSNKILQLSGNNTYTGATTINGTGIQLFTSNALPIGTALTVNTGGTLYLNNFNQTIGALTSSAGNINTGTGTGGILTIGNTAGGTVTYSGVISGKGGVTWGIINTDVANPTPSTLLLNSASTNTGPMTINTGTLSIGTAYALSGGVAPVLPYSVSATYPGAFTLGPTATLLTNGLNVTVGSLGGGGPIGGNINLGNNSSSTLYIVQSSSTGYAGIISGTGNVYIVNGVNLAVYGNWTLTGGVTHDVTNLQGNHTDSPKSYLPFAIAGNSAVTTQGINFAGFTDQVSTIFGGSSADNNAAGTFVDTGSGGKLVLSYYAASVSAGGPSNGLGGIRPSPASS